MLTYEASEVIVNSNYMKSELQRLFGLPFEKINVVPNGVNLNLYSGVERDYEFRRQYAADNEKIILFVGRLVYEKGIQHLIAAMPKILEKYHDSKLVIAGKGGMIDELKAQVNAMGISNKVYFTGYLNSKQVVKMYKCADVAVFPSTYEPFGIVALEGMLSGTPVVVSDVGGLNEIVQHGENGMKSYAGNPNSLADSIVSLLYDPALCMKVAKNAKAKVRAEYNWQKIAQDTHFAYQKAICETVAEKQAREIVQEKAQKAKKMKKLVFLFVAFAAVSFASCGNKTSQAETAADTDTVAVEEEIVEVDSVVADSAAADAAVVADSAAAEAPAAE